MKNSDLATGSYQTMNYYSWIYLIIYPLNYAVFLYLISYNVVVVVVVVVVVCRPLAKRNAGLLLFV